MAWVKLDDQFFRHPKVLAAGRDARDLYLAALCYCNSGLTDGLLAAAVMPLLAAETMVPDAGAAAERLVTVGLWEPDGDGYRIHDYLDYQPSAAQVRAQRAENARRQSEWRERKRTTREDERNAVTHSVSNAPVTPAPSPSPSPSRTPEEHTPTETASPPTPVAAARRGRAGGREATLSGFDEWWETYPRKEGKGKARDAWRAKRLTPADVPRLTSAVERQRHTEQWQREGGRFIPHPSTWLNQERWDDEPEIVVVAGARASPNGHYRPSPDEKFARSVESLARVTGLKLHGER